MAKLVNRAKMTTNTTGTGPITLDTVADGYQSFADAGVVENDIVRYVIEDGDNWEIGLGTYYPSPAPNPPSLARGVTESSNGGSEINLSGDAIVFLTAAAEDIFSLDDDVKATFGNSDDLQIYHDGSNSYVDEQGGGHLFIRSSQVRLAGPTGSQLANFSNSGSSTLFYNGSQKFTTTSTGASVTGLLNTTSLSVSGNIGVSGTVDGRDIGADGFKLDGIEAGATADQTITAGGGLTGGGTGDVTISHSDTSSQASVNNSNGNVIQDVTLDTYGHVTGLTSVDLDDRYYTETEADNRFVNVTGDTMTGDLKTTNIQLSSTTPTIWFNGTSDGGDGASSDMAIKATPEGLDFFEPEDGNKIHFQILDDTGVNAPFGYKVGSTQVIDSSGNVKKSPTLTLSGDASGSATFTDLGDATLSVTVANDSHTHDDRYYTETEADSRFVNVTGDTLTGNLVINAADASLTLNDNSGSPSDQGIRIRAEAIDTNLPGSEGLGIIFEESPTNGSPDSTPAVITTGEFYAQSDQKVFHDNYHPNADKWTTARTITLGGDLSGNVSLDGSANVTLTATVADDSHTHDGRYYTESEADSRFVNATGDTMTGLLIAENGIRVGTGDHNTAGRASITFGEGTTTSDSMYIEYDGENLSGNANAIIIGSTQAGVGDVFSVTYGGDVKVGTNSVFHDGYHPNADKLTTARNIALTGAVTGNANFDGSGNISIATTATADPTLTINGDASGSATFTNLGNATLTLTIADDSHSHSNYITSNANDTGTGGYSTSGTYWEVGNGTGSVAINTNDGYGNANLTFNHNGGVPDITGNAARIEVNVDGTSGANMNFEVKSGVTAGTAVQTTSILNLSESQVTAYKTLYENSNRVFTDGYHPNADKWTTARTLSLSGDASGSVSWDGSANATLSVTVADDSHNHVISNVDGLQTALDGKLSTTGGTLDNGTSTTLNIKCDDGGQAMLRVTGDNQGTGIIEVGQSNTYGGGISYNGDGSPAFVSGETSDHITFYRMEGGTRTEVFHYPYNSNTVNFNATPTVGGSSVWHAGNDGSGSGLDADLLDGQQGSYYLDWTNTTNKPDPTLTINGDASGSATFTDLGNATLTLTIADDSHNHTIANVDGLQTALDGKLSTTGKAADSDLLDGQDSSYYYPASNPNGYTTYSANQALDTTSNPTFNNAYIAGVIYHSGDTNTYMQFHAADQWRVVTGGAERFEINNSNVTVQSALKEKYVALSGTTPTIDVDTGGAFSLTTSGNTTFTFSAFTSALSSGFILELTAGGAHTITWPTSVDWAGGTAPDAPASGQTNIYVFWSRDGGTTWYGVLSSEAAA